MSDVVVRLRVRGVLFEIQKQTLLKAKNSYFDGLLSSGAWHPDAEGAYFIDRPAIGFDRILDYLTSGTLSVEGLTQLEEECIYSNLDYFLIPYRRQWHFSTQFDIDGFMASHVCELQDGRLCGVYENDIKVCNLSTSVVEMTIKGHAAWISQVILLQDGRACSCSEDSTVKLWSVDSGLCELTLTGHTAAVTCIVQLLDGRLCSGSCDKTIRIWSLSSAMCEITITTESSCNSLAQLPDGRICNGGNDGSISIYDLSTLECDVSWDEQGGDGFSIMCIDNSRVCSRSDDHTTIKVWSTATGECERTLNGHGGRVTCTVLMQDGRLCSASNDGSIKLWNLDTGECEQTVKLKLLSRGYFRVLQLADGRLVAYSYHASAQVIF